MIEYCAHRILCQHCAYCAYTDSTSAAQRDQHIIVKAAIGTLRTSYKDSTHVKNVSSEPSTLVHRNHAAHRTHRRRLSGCSATPPTDADLPRDVKVGPAHPGVAANADASPAVRGVLAKGALLPAQHRRRVRTDGQLADAERQGQHTDRREE